MSWQRVGFLPYQNQSTRGVAQPQPYSFYRFLQPWLLLVQTKVHVELDPRLIFVCLPRQETTHVYRYVCAVCLFLSSLNVSFELLGSFMKVCVLKFFKESFIGNKNMVVRHQVEGRCHMMSNNSPAHQTPHHKPLKVHHRGR